MFTALHNNYQEAKRLCNMTKSSLSTDERREAIEVLSDILLMCDAIKISNSSEEFKMNYAKLFDL